jgi:hypothetical protein
LPKEEHVVVVQFYEVGFIFDYFKTFEDAGEFIKEKFPKDDRDRPLEIVIMPENSDDNFYLTAFFETVRPDRKMLFISPR